MKSRRTPYKQSKNMVWKDMSRKMADEFLKSEKRHLMNELANHVRHKSIKNCLINFAISCESACTALPTKGKIQSKCNKEDMTYKADKKERREVKTLHIIIKLRLSSSSIPS